MSPLPHLYSPKPCDWYEDATHENGNYMCTCCACKQTFIGHKRRVVCKICATKDDAKAKTRAEWLHSHRAPSDWVVLTNAEIEAIKTDMAAQAWALSEAQREVKQLYAALDRLVHAVKMGDLMGCRVAATNVNVVDAQAALDEVPV